VYRSLATKSTPPELFGSTTPHTMSAETKTPLIPALHPLLWSAHPRQKLGHIRIGTASYLAFSCQCLSRYRNGLHRP
jgi:hypothetical protein